MSRNSSGVYTLPVAAFIANTVIKSVDMNSNLSDIASALTTSIATTGVSVMTGALKLFDGSQSAPGLAFATDLGTGWFRSNTYEWSFAANAGVILIANTSGLTVAQSLTVNSALTVGTTIVASGVVTSSTQLVAPDAALNTLSMAQISTPAVPSGTAARMYAQIVNFGSTIVGVPPTYYSIANSGEISPVHFRGGQCRLVLSGGSLQLQAYQGGLLTINGTPREIIPQGSSFPTLAASNTASTFVYIYAYMSGTNAIGLEQSTVTPTTSNQMGIQYKSTDQTRTLVGAAYTDTGGAWADTDGKRWVISYFNRLPKTSRVALSGATINVTASAVTQEISTSLRNQFISWSDEIAQSNVVLSVNSATAGGPSYFFNRCDNLANTYSVYVQASLQTSTIPITIPMNISGVTENTVHYVSPTILGANNTVNVLASNATTSPTAGASYVIVEIRG